MEDRPNYYSVIPATVRYDDELTPNEKLLYSEITALTNKNGECWATNSYFSNLFKVEIQSVSRWIKHLKDKGYVEVEIEYKNDTKEILKRKIKINGLPININVNTYSQNCEGGINKNVKENNINIYNIHTSSNIHTCSNKYTYMNNKKEIYKEKVLNDSDFSDDIKSSLIEWLEYKKYKYQDMGFKKLITIVKKQIKEHSEKEIIDVIDESIANNYQGITFDKIKRKINKQDKPKVVQEEGAFRLS